MIIFLILVKLRVLNLERGDGKHFVLEAMIIFINIEKLLKKDYKIHILIC